MSSSLITPELVSSIERSNAALLGDLADFVGGKTWRSGDACAAYMAPGSPLNQCVSADLEPSHIDEVREFYAGIPSGFEFGVTAFTSQEMFDALTERGWPIIEREQVLVLNLEDDWPHYAMPEGIDLRVVHGEDAVPAAEALLDGFFAPSDSPPGMVELCAATADSPGYSLIAAYDGEEPVGAANMAWSGEIGWLRGGSVGESYRHRGIHKGLQCHRLDALKEKGCRIAIMGALPGSVSQINAQKLGFQIAYTRLSFFCSNPVG